MLVPVRWRDLDREMRWELLGWHAPIWEPLLAWGLEPLGDLSKKRVLEIGCGGGGVSCLLAICGATVYATDLSFPRLRRARRLIDRYKVTNNVHLYCSDAHFPPISNQTSFDLILTRSVLVLLNRASIVPIIVQLMADESSIALFVENMKHHPLLQLWRSTIGREEARGVAFLSEEEIPMIGAHFRTMDVRHHGLLLPLAALPAWMERVAAAPLSFADDRLMALGRYELSRYSWLVALRCAGRGRHSSDQHTRYSMPSRLTPAGGPRLCAGDAR
jgi:SAM-dependent methyltransferase